MGAPWQTFCFSITAIVECQLVELRSSGGIFTNDGRCCRDVWHEGGMGRGRCWSRCQISHGRAKPRFHGACEAARAAAFQGRARKRKDKAGVRLVLSCFSFRGPLGRAARAGGAVCYGMYREPRVVEPCACVVSSSVLMARTSFSPRVPTAAFSRNWASIVS